MTKRWRCLKSGGGNSGGDARCLRATSLRHGSGSAGPRHELGQGGLELPPNGGHDLDDVLIQFQKRRGQLGRPDGEPNQTRWRWATDTRAEPPVVMPWSFSPRASLRWPRNRWKKIPRHVGFGGIVIQHLKGQPLEVVVIHDRQDAVRPVVEFIGGDVAREVGCRAPSR